MMNTGQHQSHDYTRVLIVSASLLLLLYFGHQVGSFIGVWLGGWLYDRSGSYDMVWWLGAALGIMAAIVHWPIKENPVSRVVPQKV
jgi:predicted MFS family arabinose efflux permease